MCATGELAARFGDGGADAIELPLRHGVDRAGAAGLRGALRGLDVCTPTTAAARCGCGCCPASTRGSRSCRPCTGCPIRSCRRPRDRGARGGGPLLAYRGLDAKLAWRCDAVITPTDAMRSLLVGRSATRRGG